MHRDARHDDPPDPVDRGRRRFLAAAGFLPALAVALRRRRRAVAAGGDAPRKARFFFTSQGKTALVNADGSGLRYFDFDKPGQATWQLGGDVPRRPARPLPEHGAAARRPRAAVRRVLHADPDAPLGPRPRDRLAGGDLHQGSARAVRDAGPPAGRRSAPGAGGAQERRPDLQRPPRRDRRRASSPAPARGSPTA